MPRWIDLIEIYGSKLRVLVENTSETANKLKHKFKHYHGYGIPFGVVKIMVTETVCTGTIQLK
jgi:hypothetical protein